jgi:hypothetical protein
VVGVLEYFAPALSPARSKNFIAKRMEKIRDAAGMQSEFLADLRAG